MQLQEINHTFSFTNEIINKRKLQNLMSLAFHNYGIVKSSIIADKLKNLTFHYATNSGISLSIEDLRVPLKKRHLIGLTNNDVETTEEKYEIGNITSVERFQKVIDIWNNASNFLKDEVLIYFRESDPLNPLYIMAFSGARGNISQVRQLVGMRGLMADPQGQIIDLPIKSNFREGLKVTEYIISSYGARKGLVDTALRTADSGYLTRRLVDVAQDIIVREDDCHTQDSLSKEDIEKYMSSLSLKDKIVGRLLADSFTFTTFDVVQSDKLETIEQNTAITVDIVKKFEKVTSKTFNVRSPLTCNSVRSVCRNCYGWHLSYSTIVDLGEAVGIIAAQSIGEPGTQLTMRTFHTGGVFSGDLTKQIRTPFSGTVFFRDTTNNSLVRTIHGEKGFKLREKLALEVENERGTKISLLIPPETTLLVNKNQKVHVNQIIAEIKKDANLVLEEDRKDIYTEVSGEAVFRNIEVTKNIDKQGTLLNVNKKTGLIWVLFGERYSLSRSAKLSVKLGENIYPEKTIAKKKIINKYSGIVSFDRRTQSIVIMNSSFLVKNLFLSSKTEAKSSEHILETTKGQKFQLQAKPNEVLRHGQTIAVFVDNSYKTDTGGIVAYSIESSIAQKKTKNTKKMFSGTLYWIAEETHRVPNTVGPDSIKIRDGDFIEAGTEILPNIYNKVSGFVSIDKSANEMIIKPGELFLLTDKTSKQVNKKNKFVKAGQQILPNIFAQNLVYLEFFSLNDASYLLARPVRVYDIPKEKEFSLKNSFFPSVKDTSIKLKTVKRIFFKNWERVKSVNGVNLLQTILLLEMRNFSPNLQPKLEFHGIKRKNLAVSFYEVLKTDEGTINELNQRMIGHVQYMVKENQYVVANTVLAQNKITANILGTVASINLSKGSTKEVLILKEKDIKKIPYESNNDSPSVNLGSLIRKGTLITNKIKSNYSGQVYAIDNSHISIRIGRSYMISEGTILHVKSGTLVQRSDILATLVYDKLKTVDIVQGLPKVEEILEARKIRNGCLLSPSEGTAYLRNSRIEITDLKGNQKIVNLEQKAKIRFTNGDFVNLGEPLTDGAISPHEMLDLIFEYYREIISPIEACKKSFKYLQLFLVNEVQRTYLSQGVQIADKHIEIIVKQMTSKVRIEDSGDTTLLPGEILSMNQAKIISEAASSANQTPPLYLPILLGLTKASLNSDSFISAASFQETTRVLTEAAIEGKKDWLNGLKENVIIGRLIPAGTGFNSYINLKQGIWRNNESDLISLNQEGNIKDNVLNSRLKNL